MASASIVSVWNRMNQVAKAGTAGYDDQDEFNGKIDVVQKQLSNLLIDNAEGNQKITDALMWLRKTSDPLVCDANGIIPLPDDYSRLDSIAYVDNSGVTWPSHKLASNEVDMTRSSPVRKPNLALNETYYYFQNQAPVMMPEQPIKAQITYYPPVPAATIVLTPNSDTNSDYLVPTVGDELGWPDFCQNLIIYMVLEQFGVECKEELLVEFAQLGINREVFKSQEKAA